MDTSRVRSPVYQQLNQRLRTALATEYRSGDQFLTEREVAEKFQVSRATANKSLASLVWLAPGSLVRCMSRVCAASPAIPVGLSRDEGKTRHVSRVLVPGVFR